MRSGLRRRSGRPTSTCGRGRPDLFKRKPRLLAQRGEVEVDRLAGHEPLAERDDVGEWHGEGATAWSDPQPFPPTGPTQGPPDSDDVVANGHAVVLRRQVRERGEELLFVGRSDRVPALASEPERHRLEERVRDEGLEDGVDVARRFRLAVGFEEAKHLVAVHGHSPSTLTPVARSPMLPWLRATSK